MADQKRLLIHVATVPQFLYYFLDGQVGYMKSQGFEVHCVSSEGDLLDELSQREQAPVHRIALARSISPAADLAALYRLYRLFRTLRPQIVHAHTPKGGLLGMAAARLAGVPVRIYHIHGLPYMTATGLSRKLLKFTERVSCLLANRVLSVSPSIRQVVREDLICPSEKIGVIANGSINGVDAAGTFNPEKVDRGQVKRELNIPDRAQVIGFVGRIVRDKGIAELLQAWESLRQTLPELYLLLVGPLEDRGEIARALRDKHSHDPRIICTGEVRCAAPYYAAMDVLVLPSHREGFGQVLVEASAMNLPIVATRVAGCVDAVVEGETGTLVPLKDARALEEALARYLRDPGLMKIHGDNGRRRVLSLFRPQDVWKSTLAEYALLCGGPGVPGTPIALRDSPQIESRFSMIKILYVTRVPITAVRFILPLASRLRELGVTVEFAFGEGEGLPDMDASGFRYHLMTMNKRSISLQNAAVVRELAGIIERGGYDLVHTYSPVIGIYGRLAARAAGGKRPLVVHSVIGSLLAEGVPLSHRIMYIASELFTSSLVDLFITLNDGDADAMVRHRLAGQEKVVSLKYEYGVDLQAFDPAGVDRGKLKEVRSSHGLDSGEPVIGFVGRMIGAKGILDLFNAYRMVRERGIRAKLVYLGDVLSTDGDQQSFRTLRRMVAEAGLEKDVLFLGFQKEVPFYLSLMDVVILPSHHEGFPRIPVEAGALGKPSITSATSGADVAVEDGVTGYIVPIKDPKSLAEAIEKVVGHPERAREMGGRARQRVVDLFDQVKIVEQQVDIYRTFLKGKGISSFPGNLAAGG
ncbi:hypothetical protein GMSM_20740 [Geomonas sp. Red276]